MIPLEIAEQTIRVSNYDPEVNQVGREAEVDMISEIRDATRIKQQAVKALLAAKYNKKIKKRDLEEGDLDFTYSERGIPCLPSPKPPEQPPRHPPIGTPASRPDRSSATGSDCSWASAFGECPKKSLKNQWQDANDEPSPSRFQKSLGPFPQSPPLEISTHPANEQRQPPPHPEPFASPSGTW
ncbi:hypothetical protein PIB30_081510 [Stylosanthes scabra]|uniref:Uncharacterized protein n=1 Tax=Stylosanthes scabra TaxID=79078 RepID=A0ABU6UUD4_9FABA|nr:hypothetical protein [Stylosanthes scabra]